MNYYPSEEQMHVSNNERNGREARHNYVQQLNPKLETPAKKHRDQARRTEQPAVLLPSVAAAALAVNPPAPLTVPETERPPVLPVVLPSVAAAALAEEAALALSLEERALQTEQPTVSLVV